METNAQNADVKVYYMKSAMSGRQLYNAGVAYGGTIVYGVQPGRSLVTFSVQGHGQFTVDMIATNVLNRVGTVLNGIFGHLLPMQPWVQGGPVDNFRVRTGNVEQWATSGDEAITFPTDMITNMWGQATPGKTLVTVATTINLNNVETQSLMTSFGSNNIQQVVEKYLYSILMHEFLHGFGLTHNSTPDMPQTPVYQFNLNFTDHNQIMHRVQNVYDGIDYLEDLRNSLGRPVQEADILPSTGEMHTLMNLLNNCVPPLEAAISAKDQCYTDVTKSGVTNYINPALPPTYISIN
ncbi:hypothetical protein GCM10011491_10240 [Brucella endophytica]|uniref:Uncharacterized protein n=2 Tax=Brucella endophytica TaxID=1963359 RepID=A0A916S540_9HYPH|nr:hypothetical protein GCM10011491_10240 [Brucella endophytica]